MSETAAAQTPSPTTTEATGSLPTNDHYNETTESEDNSLDDEFAALRASLERSNEQEESDIDFDSLPDTDNDYESDETEQEDDDGLITLKVNGKQQELPLKEVIALAQKHIASEMTLDKTKEKLAQAAAEREQLKVAEQRIRQSAAMIQQFINQLASDRPDVHAAFYNKLREINPNAPTFEQVLHKYIEEQLEWNAKSNEEKLQIQLQRERAFRENLLRQQQLAKQQQAHAYQVRQYWDHITTEAPKAMKQVGLPETKRNVARLAEVWQQLVRQGHNPTALEVAQAVKRERSDNNLAELAEASDDHILDMLGPDLVRKIEQAKLKKAKVAQKRPIAKRDTVRKSQNQGKYVTPDEWLKIGR